MYPEFLPTPTQCAALGHTEARRHISALEKFFDQQFREGTIDQETAWDGYFGLLHECDERMMWEDRVRILQKIDTAKYNPLKSKNSGIVLIACIRLRQNARTNN